MNDSPAKRNTQRCAKIDGADKIMMAVKDIVVAFFNNLAQAEKKGAFLTDCVGRIDNLATKPAYFLVKTARFS